MTKLDERIELNYLEKLNRKNRLEDKLKQQEYYGEIEELLDPLTKTLKANTEHNLALSEKTLRAIEWQNQELDKQTRMIQQAGSQFNEALMKSNCKAVEEARDKPGLLVDKDTAQIINLLSVQSNPQLKLKFGNLDIGEFEMNGVKLIYQENAFKDDVFGRGLNSNSNQQSFHHYVDPYNIIERLELIILETKAGHDGLYNELLDISKQLLSMNIINQEQLDNFVFNYGK